MKPVWIAFHLFMVIIYLALGCMFLLTKYFPVVTGTARVILGLAFVGYALFRGYNVFRSYNRRGL